MGQQQLLIIVLVAIVVGLAITAGLRFLDSVNQSNDRDLVLQQMRLVLTDAKKYAATPRFMGGGEGTFTGFDPLASLVTTTRVTLSTTTGSDWILFQGYGTVTGWNGTDPVQVVAQFNLTQNEWTEITNVN